jgi:hypothetical protein
MVLTIGLGSVWGQINTKYAFMQSSTIWEPVYGTYATDAMTDEGLAGPFEIGFNFPYGTNTYTQVKISSNGWVNPGANLVLPYYGNGLATLNILPVLTPLWDDLGMQTGAVQFGTYGEAPNRIFIVQWLAAKWKYNASNEYNFMVRMHESGQVDLVYGPHTGMPDNPSATIGINMAPGGSGNYYNVVPGLIAQAYTSTQYNDITTFPDNGTMYIFMPKTDISTDAAALNLRGPKNPMQTVNANYVVTVGNAGNTIIPQEAITARLKRGDEVLAVAALPSLTPGGFAEVLLPWVPDTTGLMYLSADLEWTGDLNSLNNETYSYAITVQPFVGNADATIPAPQLNLTVSPNPFRERTVISFSLDKAKTGSLTIYNLRGQVVRRLETGAKNSGSVFWDGRNDQGHPVPSGMYLAKLSTGGSSVARKLVMLR